MKLLATERVLFLITGYPIMNPTISLLLLFPAIVWGFVGYDCGARSLKINTISNLGVEECPTFTNQLNITKRYIQLVQINDYISTKVFQCKLEVDRTTYECGMFSHNSIVENGESEYIREISREKSHK